MKKVVFSMLGMLFILPGFSQVEFIAHRGASYLAPENTVAAANLAWELDADAVEIDVFLAKDNRVIVSHDKSTKRTTGIDYKIDETDSGELRELDAGSWKDSRYKGEKLPFVEEVLATVPDGKKLIIEIKCGSEVLPALKKAIDDGNKIDRIEFISFGWETIVDTKKAFPDNRCYWLSSVKPGLQEKMEEAVKVGLDGVDLQSSVIDKTVMESAKKLGLEVLAWTVDDPAEAKRLKEMGVKGITTNRPGWLREQLTL